MFLILCKSKASRQPRGPASNCFRCWGPPRMHRRKASRRSSFLILIAQAVLCQLRLCTQAQRKSHPLPIPSWLLIRDLSPLPVRRFAPSLHRVEAFGSFNCTMRLTIGSLRYGHDQQHGNTSEIRRLTLKPALTELSSTCSEFTEFCARCDQVDLRITSTDHLSFS